MLAQFITFWTNVEVLCKMSPSLLLVLAVKGKDYIANTSCMAFDYNVKQSCWKSFGNEDVAQLVEHRTGTLPTQVRFLGTARDFPPSVNFQCRLSLSVSVQPPCAIACINVCALVKDSAVHVRVLWILETLG